MRADITSQVVTDISAEIEHLYIRCNINGKKFIIGGVYLPPNSPSIKYEMFTDTVEDLISKYLDHKFIICGDFNLPGISWSNDNDGLIYSTTSSPRGYCVPESLAANNFYQVNNVFNSFGSILDLIFVTHYNLNVYKAPISAVPEDHYHPALSIDLTPVNTQPLISSPHSFFDFRRADYTSINDFFLYYNWADTISQLDANGAASAILDALHESVLRYVPRVNCSPSNFPSWFSKDLIDVVFQKRKAHALYKNSLNPDDYRTFSLLRARYKYMSKKCYRLFIKNTETAFCSNPSKFWDFVRKNRSNSSIPKVVKLNGINSSNNEDVTNLFSKHFKSVYSYVNTSYIPPFIPNLPHDLPNNCFFDLSDVMNGLIVMKNKKSTGPDGLSGEFLYNIRHTLCFPLWFLFRKSLDSGVYPEIFKLSSVTPVFKSGDNSDVCNYRPISILSHISKLFESLVLHSVQPVLNPTLIEEQHGFRPNRSTTTCNLVFVNYVFEAFAGDNQVDVIYTDFCKAFDRVNHKTLMKVLLDSGFGEPLLSWLGSYLNNRKQYVKVLGSKSEIFTIPSGVPQGGHLSPLLFSLFINSVKAVIQNSKFLLFADDLKLFLRVSCIKDCQMLQNDLFALSDWANNLGLEFNIKKCHSMSFYRTHHLIKYSYSLNDVSLDVVNTVIDLGISFDRELNFCDHVEKSCCKALKTLGFIKRVSSEFNLLAPLKSLYCALVRSILEYAVVIWDPYTAIAKSQIERVQRKFLNFAARVLHIAHQPHNYEPVLIKLGLTTLADRRSSASQDFLRKLMDGSIDCPDLLGALNFKVPSFHSRSPYPFYIPICTTNYSYNRPMFRLMRLANENVTASTFL